MCMCKYMNDLVIYMYVGQHDCKCVMVPGVFCRPNKRRKTEDSKAVLNFSTGNMP